jgi:hypothetical protein
LRDQAAKALADLSSAIYRRGERRLAAEVRQWTEGPDQALIVELNVELVARIISTPRSQRRTKQQKDTLARLALQNTLEFMAFWKGDAEEQRRRVQENYDRYQLLARELVEWCGELYLIEPRSRRR